MVTGSNLLLSSVILSLNVTYSEILTVAK
jgi:hypothetical protein